MHGQIPEARTSSWILVRFVSTAPHRSSLNFIYFFFFRAAPVASGSSHTGIKLERQPPAYTTATATAELDLSCICKPTPQPRAMLDPPPTERGQGLKLRPSWILVRVVSAEPRWEPLPELFLCVWFSSIAVHSGLREIRAFVCCQWECN